MLGVRPDVFSEAKTGGGAAPLLHEVRFAPRKGARAA
jgi:hypothetical protein